MIDRRAVGLGKLVVNNLAVERCDANVVAIVAARAIVWIWFACGGMPKHGAITVARKVALLPDVQSIFVATNFVRKLAQHAVCIAPDSNPDGHVLGGFHGRIIAQ